MSQYVPPSVLASLREEAVSALPDTCMRRIWAQMRDSDHQEIGEAWTDGATFPCRLLPAGTRETGTNQVTTQDQLRLPLTAVGVLSSRDRIQVTARYGTAESPVREYTIDGDLLVGPSLVTVRLQRVSNG